MPVMVIGRRKWLRPILAAGLIVISVVVVFFLGEHQALRRYFSFAAYGNAVEHWSFVHNGLLLPAELGRLESEWNGSDRCMQPLPAPPTYTRPIYRPPRGVQGGPFLLVIEPEPKGVSYPIRHLVFARSDGSELRMARAWRWELEHLIALDDALRATSLQSKSHNTPQPTTGRPGK